MRVLASIIGIIIVILAIIGLQSASANAANDDFTLSPQSGSGVKGSVYLSADSPANTLVIVQATGMAAFTNHAFARMDANCASVVQMLNPLMANIAGDGGSTSIAAGTPDGTWWFGILSGTSSSSNAAACGQVGGAVPGTPTARPAPTATPASSMQVPVVQGTTPPDAPVVNPNTTPTPLGS